jgi:hypothetical protein
MAIFYYMINIAAVNALVIYAYKMHKDQPEKKIKRKDFLLRTAHDLVKPFVTQRYKLPTLPRNIKTVIVVCIFASDSEENTMQDPEDYEAIARKRGRCHVLQQESICGETVCLQRMWTLRLQRPYEYDCYL